MDQPVKPDRLATQASQGVASRTTDGVNLTGFWRLYEIHRLISQGT